MPSVIRQNPFAATLLASQSFTLSVEQTELMQRVLELSSSDSFFARKAYEALRIILTSGSVVPPIITSLNPPTTTVGSPSFLLHVLGTGFTPTSAITFNGLAQSTTYVSATELTIPVDMSIFTVPISGIVGVLNDNVASNTITFSITL